MKDAIDSMRLGARLESLRSDAGFKRMTDVADQIEQQFGVVIRASTLYSYESGRTVPPLKNLLCLLAIISPGNGLDVVKVAVNTDIRRAVWGDRS